jgi:hypothetical protein
MIVLTDKILGKKIDDQDMTTINYIITSFNVKQQNIQAMG